MNLAVQGVKEEGEAETGHAAAKLYAHLWAKSIEARDSVASDLRLASSLEQTMGKDMW